MASWQAKSSTCQSCRLSLLNNERTLLSVIHREPKCCVSYICCYLLWLCPWVLPSPFGGISIRSKMVYLAGFKCFLSSALCSGTRQLHLQFPIIKCQLSLEKKRREKRDSLLFSWPLNWYLRLSPLKESWNRNLRSNCCAPAKQEWTLLSR